MFFHVTQSAKHSSANMALEHLQLFVNRFNVDILCHLPGKLLLTNVTMVPLDFIVRLNYVSFQLNLERIPFVTLLADKLLNPEVNRVDVIGKAIFSPEFLFAPVAS
jgi:hypothetical protein